MTRSVLVVVMARFAIAMAAATVGFAASATAPAMRRTVPAQAGFSIVYLKDHTLWRAHVATAQGKVQLTSKSERICRLPRVGTRRWLSLVVSQNGARAAIDDGDGSGTYLVDLRPGAKPRFLRGVQHPSFSPDGSEVAVSSGASPDPNTDPPKSVVVLDIRRHRWRIVRAKAEWPVWSRDGSEIVMIDNADADPQCYGSVLVVDAHSGRLKFSASKAIAPADPVLSPNGRYVGVIHELSRPKMGHFLLDRKMQAPLNRDFDYPDRLPAVLEDWSPDSKYALWDWREPDPNNDGCWLADEVGVTSIRPGLARWIDTGEDARFSPDGRWIAYLHANHKGIRPRPAAICIQPFGGGTRIRLVKAVDAFAVFR